MAKVAQLGHQVGRMGFECSLSDLKASLNLRSSQPSTTSLPPPHTLACPHRHRSLIPGRMDRSTLGNLNKYPGAEREVPSHGGRWESSMEEGSSERQKWGPGAVSFPLRPVPASGHCKPVSLSRHRGGMVTGYSHCLHRPPPGSAQNHRVSPPRRWAHQTPAQISGPSRRSRPVGESPR